ncbi:MAG: M23 family metallopeptidase [Oscillospiraceae bacterium]|nr:M23 family metallopeptidase [Oscillospiraceae bacterium]
MGRSFWSGTYWLNLKWEPKKVEENLIKACRNIYHDFWNLKVMFQNLSFSFLEVCQVVVIRLSKAAKHFGGMAKEESLGVLFKELYAFCAFKYGVYKKAVWRFLRACFALSSAVVCFLTIRRFNSIEYGIEIWCNGEIVGLVENELDFEEAQKLARSRILEPSSIYIKPQFAIKVLEPEKITSQKELADRLVKVLGNDIVEASGLYLDKKFLGATTEKEQLKKELEMVKAANAQGQNCGGEVLFEKAVEVQDALYPKASVLPFATDFKSMIYAKERKEVDYTIIKGDSVEKIIERYEMTMSEFEKLNEGEINPGNTVRVLKSVPLFNVKFINTEIKQEKMPFKVITTSSTCYPLGTSFVRQRGKDGEIQITYNVTYVDGIEQSKVAISKRVITEPINKHVIIGQKYKYIESDSGILSDLKANFMWPLVGGKGYVSCYFSGPTHHRGIDICAETGSVILASDSGEIVSAGWEGTYGKSVVIRHENGLLTRYAHNSEIYVRVAQRVSKGEQIAAIGRTGYATGTHLHFEVLYEGKQVDPLRFISSQKGTV